MEYAHEFRFQCLSILLNYPCPAPTNRLGGRERQPRVEIKRLFRSQFPPTGLFLLSSRDQLLHSITFENVLLSSAAVRSTSELRKRRLQILETLKNLRYLVARRIRHKRESASGNSREVTGKLIKFRETSVLHLCH